MTIKVKVKFRGVFRWLSKESQITVELEEAGTVNGVVKKLTKSYPEEFKRELVDPELKDPRPNALILVNGREISVLNGLETKVNEGDEILFIPILHGG